MQGNQDKEEKISCLRCKLKFECQCVFGWQPLKLSPQVINMNTHVLNADLLQPTMYLAVR